MRPAPLVLVAILTAALVGSAVVPLGHLHGTATAGPRFVHAHWDPHPDHAPQGNAPVLSPDDAHDVAATRYYVVTVVTSLFVLAQPAESPSPIWEPPTATSPAPPREVEARPGPSPPGTAIAERGPPA